MKVVTGKGKKKNGNGKKEVMGKKRLGRGGEVIGKSMKNGW